VRTTGASFLGTLGAVAGIAGRSVVTRGSTLLFLFPGPRVSIRGKGSETGLRELVVGSALGSLELAVGKRGAPRVSGTRVSRGTTIFQSSFRLPGASCLSALGASGFRFSALGVSDFGGLGLGTSALGASAFGASAFGASAFGAFGASGFGVSDFGGFSLSALSALGTSALGAFGASGFGASDFGVSALGAVDLGASGGVTRGRPPLRSGVGDSIRGVAFLVPWS
jgi:hypothetical protein